MSTFTERLRRHGGTIGLIVIVLLLDVLALSQAGGSVERQLFVGNVMIQVIFVGSVGYLYRIVGVASFGQAIFYGGAAYTVGLAAPHVGSSTLLLLIGVGAATIAAAVVGLFIFRVPGLSFAILTLALGESLFVLARRERWTGGDTGLFGFGAGRLFGLDISTPGAFVASMVVFTSLGMLLLWWLEYSRFGVVLRAIRSSDRRAAALGAGIRTYRYAGFVVAGAVSGVCGSLYALLWNLVSPDILQWSTSGDPIIMTLIGGMGSIVGPVIGCVAFLYLVDIASAITDQWELWVGTILLVVILAAPRGVVGLVDDAVSRVLRRKEEAHRVR